MVLTYTDPMLIEYRKRRGEPFGLKKSRNSTVAETNDHPLLFEPGEGWEYSVGVDWAGEMVSRVNGDVTLEAYLQQHVFSPLGMKNFTFHPASTPAVLEKLVDMSQREGGLSRFGTAADPSGKLIYTEDTIWDLETIHCHGGGGAYGPPLEFQKLLHSLTANDGKVLKPASVDMLFEPQLTPAAKGALAFKRGLAPQINNTYSGVPQDIPTDFGLGGIINLEGYPGRSKGSLCWGGYPNLVWWCDRIGGISGIIGTQISPPGDEKVVGHGRDFAEEVYTRAGLKEKL